MDRARDGGRLRAGGRAGPAPACQLVKIGELSVTTAHNQPLAAIAINGHAASMLVDTGADQADIVTVRDFGLGDAAVHDLTPATPPASRATADDAPSGEPGKRQE
jgi:predicted aspartyl protease